MSEHTLFPTVVEALPEGSDRVWVTLNDGITRLVSLQPLLERETHRALRLDRLARRPAVAPDGTYVLWPGGAHLDALSIHRAPNGPLPVTLLAVVPATRRYRPLAALLTHLDPPPVDPSRPQDAATACRLLGLQPAELASLLPFYNPAPADLVAARLTDLGRLLTHLLPDANAHALLRCPWPHAIHTYPGRRLLHTALGCLRSGRADLVEAPLVTLILGVTHAPQASVPVGTLGDTTSAEPSI